MVDAHRSAGLEHDAVYRTGAEDLLDESQAILLDLLSRGTQCVGIGVAERVADHQVGMRAAQGAVVCQHDPCLDLETLGRELAVSIAERVAFGIPCRDGGDETITAPYLFP